MNPENDQKQPISTPVIRPNIRIILYKNRLPILIILLLAAISFGSLGVIVSNNVAKTEAEKELVKKEQISEASIGSVADVPADPVDGTLVPIYNDDGTTDYVSYMYNGTIIVYDDKGGIDKELSNYDDVPKDPNQLTVDEANKKAADNPGTEYCGVSGGNQEFCFTADENHKTYYSDTYDKLFPPEPVVESPSSNYSNNTPKTNPPDADNSTSTKTLRYDEARKMAKDNPGKEFCGAEDGGAFTFCLTADENGKTRYTDQKHIDSEAAIKLAHANPGQIHCGGGNCYYVTTEDQHFSAPYYVYSNKNGDEKKAREQLEADLAKEKADDLQDKAKDIFDSIFGNSDNKEPSQQKPVENQPKPQEKVPNNGTPDSPVSAVIIGFDSMSDTETAIAVAAMTDGVGTNTRLGQNPNPVRPANFQIELIDSNNNTIHIGAIPVAASIANTSSSDLTFGGLLSLGENITPGAYKARIRLDNTLWKSVDVNLAPGPGKTATIPPFELVLGDIDQDNSINLLDYNYLLECFGGKSCIRPLQSDLNLDGKIDELDLNLLYASFAKRQGD